VQVARVAAATGDDFLNGLFHRRSSTERIIHPGTFGTCKRLQMEREEDGDVTSPKPCPVGAMCSRRYFHDDHLHDGVVYRRPSFRRVRT
jgi:hypothetical protein